MFRKRLEEKVALVTGAAQGIGKETAIVLAKEGAIVVVSDINDSLGESVAKEIGGNCIYIHLDVANEKDWEQVISTVTERFGKLNILVNNAGVIGARHRNDCNAWHQSPPRQATVYEAVKKS